MFETGEPASGPELNEALRRLVAEGAAFAAGFGDEAFFAPQGRAWSPAEHIRHLRRSTAAVAAGMRVPRALLALRFGRPRRPSRSFAEVREAYLACLAAGGQAGRYAPSPEPPPDDPAARRAEVLAHWRQASDALGRAIARFDERPLDRYGLPHPLLGLLTLREMLAFTVYHTAHHLRRVAERAG